MQRSCAAEDVTADCIAVYRPVSGGFAVIASNFAGALAAAYGGADPQEQLTLAATAIDQDRADNNDYK